MGANIYPEDIETLVYRDATLVPRLHSFLLSVMDDESGVPRPMVALELADLAGIDDSWRTRMADQLRDGLTGLNIDYRSSIAEFPDAMQPIVTTYALGRGRSPRTPDASSSVASSGRRQERHERALGRLRSVVTLRRLRSGVTRRHLGSVEETRFE